MACRLFVSKLVNEYHILQWCWYWEMVCTGIKVSAKFSSYTISSHKAGPLRSVVSPRPEEVQNGPDIERGPPWAERHCPHGPACPRAPRGSLWWEWSVRIDWWHQAWGTSDSGVQGCNETTSWGEGLRIMADLNCTPSERAIKELPNAFKNWHSKLKL